MSKNEKTKIEFAQWRDDYLLNLAKGRKVLHIGCTDWPYTEEKIENGTLFHDKLVKVAKKVVGIDISEEGVKVMRKRGYSDVFVENVYNLGDRKDIVEKYGEFDYIYLPEVLEHIPCPEKALTSIRKFIEKYSPNAKLVITVPNAMSYTSFIHKVLNKDAETTRTCTS